VEIFYGHDAAGLADGAGLAYGKIDHVKHQGNQNFMSFPNLSLRACGWGPPDKGSRQGINPASTNPWVPP
jgi:hypothetical protein